MPNFLTFNKCRKITMSVHDVSADFELARTRGCLNPPFQEPSMDVMTLSECRKFHYMSQDFVMNSEVLTSVEPQVDQQLTEVVMDSQVHHVEHIQKEMMYVQKNMPFCMKSGSLARRITADCRLNFVFYLCVRSCWCIDVLCLDTGHHCFSQKKQRQRLLGS